MLTAAELKKLVAQGANCICVYPVADESSRVRIEQDLIEGNDQWGAQLQFLFRAPVPERAPGISGES